MGRFITAEWTDLDGNIRELRQARNNISSQLERIMLRAGLILEAEIKVVITEISANNPVTRYKNGRQVEGGALIDTGFLRINWTTYVESRLTTTETRVSTSTEYAEWLDSGNNRIKAYKFTEKAWARARPKIIAYLERELGNISILRR